MNPFPISHTLRKLGIPADTFSSTKGPFGLTSLSEAKYKVWQKKIEDLEELYEKAIAQCLKQDDRSRVTGKKEDFIRTRKDYETSSKPSGIPHENLITQCKSYNKKIDEQENIKRTWENYEKASGWFADEKFWTDLKDSLPIEKQTALGNWQTLWLKHAKYAHYPADILLNAAAIVAEIDSIAEDAFREAKQTTSLFGQALDKVSQAPRKFNATVKTIFLGEENTGITHPSEKKIEFVQEYLRYLESFKESIAHLRKSIAASMLARLKLAYKKKGIADILGDLAEKVYDVFIKSDITIVKLRNGNITHIETWKTLQSPYHQQLSPKSFNEFILYLVQVDPDFLQSKKVRFSWLNSTSYEIGLPIDLGLVCLERMNTLAIVPKQTPSILDILKEAVKENKIASYLGPSPHQLATYYTNKNALRELLGKKKEKKEMTARLCKLKDPTDLHMPLTQSIEFLLDLVKSISQYESDNKVILDRLFLFDHVKNISQDDPDSTIISAWKVALDLQFKPLLTYIDCMLSALLQCLEKVTPRSSFTEFLVVDSKIVRTLVHFLTTLKDFSPNIEELKGASQVLQSIKDKLVEHIPNLLINEGDVKTILLFINYFTSCGLQEQYSHNLIVDILTGHTLPKDVEELRQAILKLSPVSHPEDKHERPLRTLISLIIDQIKQRTIIPFLQSCDELLHSQYVKTWEDLHRSQVVKCHSTLKNSLLRKSNTASLEEATDALKYIQDFYSPEEAKTHLEIITRDFLESYQGSHTIWHPLFYSINASTIKDRYFSKRFDYLLENCSITTKAVLLSECKEFKNLLTFADIKINFNKIVVDCFSNPLHPIHTVLSSKEKEDILVFLTLQALEYCDNILDAYCYDSLCALLQTPLMPDDYQERAAKLKKIYSPFPSTPQVQAKVSALVSKLCYETWTFERSQLVDELIPTHSQRYRFHWFQSILKNAKFAEQNSHYRAKKINSIQGLLDFYGKDFFPLIVSEIQGWLNHPTKNQFAFDLLRSYLREASGIYGQSEVSTYHLSSYEQVKREYDQLKELENTSKKIHECLVDSDFSTLKDILEGQFMIVRNAGQDRKKKGVCLSCLILDPIETSLKTLLTNDECKESELFSTLNRFKTEALPKNIDPIEQQLLAGIQFILKHAQDIYALNMNLFSAIRTNENWPNCFDNHKIACIWQGFTTENLQLLYETFLELEIETMDPMAAEIWQLFTKLLKMSNTEQGSEEFHGLLNRLKKKITEFNKEVTQHKQRDLASHWKKMIVTVLLPANFQTEQQDLIFSSHYGVVRFDPTVRLQLFDDKGGLRFLTSSSGQNHYVKELKLLDGSSIYIKIKPDAPGNEMAVRALHRLSFDPHMPHAELIKMQDSTSKEPYPALLSETVRGKTLSDFWNEGHQVCWDRKSFTRKFLLTLLTNPMDEKPENFIVQELNSSGDPPLHRLICVDNDQSFVPPFYGETQPNTKTDPQDKAHPRINPQSDSTHRRIHLGVKTVIFCFDEMKKPLDASVIDEVLQCDINKLLRTWTIALCSINEPLSCLFDLNACAKLRNQNPPVELLAQIERTLIPTLYHKLLKIKDFLKKAHQSKKPTLPIDLLYHLYPELASHYGRVLSQEISPIARFQQATEKEYDVQVIQEDNGKTTVHFGTSTTAKEVTQARSPDLMDLKSWQEQPKVHARAALDMVDSLFHQNKSLENVRAELLQGKTGLFKGLLLDSFREKVIHSLSLHQLPLQLQSLILTTMVGTSFESLDLHGCQALTNEHLFALLRHSPHLRTLNISQCNALELCSTEFLPPAFFYLEDSYLRDIGTYCPYLEGLNLSGIDTLRNIDTSNLRELRYLNINHCRNLSTEEKIKAPKLTHLWAKDCPSLVEITIKSLCDIQRIDLDDCISLEKFSPPLQGSFLDIPEKMQRLTFSPKKIQKLTLSNTVITQIKFLGLKWTTYAETKTPLFPSRKEQIVTVPRKIQKLTLSNTMIKHAGFYAAFPFLINVNLDVGNFSKIFVEKLNDYLKIKLSSGLLKEKHKNILFLLIGQYFYNCIKLERKVLSWVFQLSSSQVLFFVDLLPQLLNARNGNGELAPEFIIPLTQALKDQDAFTRKVVNKTLIHLQRQGCKLPKEIIQDLEKEEEKEYEDYSDALFHVDSGSSFMPNQELRGLVESTLTLFSEDLPKMLEAYFDFEALPSKPTLPRVISQKKKNSKLQRKNKAKEGEKVQEQQNVKKVNAEILRKLNAAGNDISLHTTTQLSHYWYSIGDGFHLLVNMRREFTFTQHGKTFPIKALGEEYSPHRENHQGIFLSDPYATENFSSSLKNDIKVITGGYQKKNLSNRNHCWENMPTLLIIPVLSGRHWRVLRIEIEYQSREVSILWDDPYGQDSFSQVLKEQFRKSLKRNISRLFAKQTGKPDFILTAEYDKSIDHQGPKNSWDCGPITFSNAKDYIQVSVQNKKFVNGTRYYQMTPASDKDHSNQIHDIRRAHQEIYRSIEEISTDTEKKMQISRETVAEVFEYQLQGLMNLQEIEQQISEWESDKVSHFYNYLEEERLGHQNFEEPFTIEEIRSAYEQVMQEV